jgi:hypothetical protein
MFDISEKKEVWGAKSSQSDLWSELELILITEMSRTFVQVDPRLISVTNKISSHTIQAKQKQCCENIIIRVFDINNSAFLTKFDQVKSQ